MIKDGITLSCLKPDCRSSSFNVQFQFVLILLLDGHSTDYQPQTVHLSKEQDVLLLCLHPIQLTHHSNWLWHLRSSQISVVQCLSFILSEKSWKGPNQVEFNQSGWLLNYLMYQQGAKKFIAVNLKGTANNFIGTSN